MAQGAQDTVAFIGLGTMGTLMSRRLAGAGHPLRAFDLDGAALARGAAEEGAEAAESPRSAATGADVVVLSLPSPRAVEEVVCGEDGVLAGLESGRAIVDMSTIDPATSRRVHAAAAERGCPVLDAPVSGGPTKAETGTLTIMVGGDEAVLERCRPVLARLGTNIIRVGPPGSGQVAKLCNNMLLGVILGGIAETFATGVKAGVDARVLHEVVCASTGGSTVLESWVPLTTLKDDYTPRFSLDLLHKDVSLFAQTADLEGVPVPIAAATEQMIKAARCRGLGALDMTAVVKLYEELAGVRWLEGPGGAV